MEMYWSIKIYKIHFTFFVVGFVFKLYKSYILHQIPLALKKVYLESLQLKQEVTSTRVLHRCVYVNQENINLQKDITRYKRDV